MKRVITIALALVMVFGAAVSASAVTYPYYADIEAIESLWDYKFLIENEDGNTLLGIFKISDASYEVKEWWNGFTAAITGGASDYEYLVEIANASDAIYIYRFPVGTVFTRTSQSITSGIYAGYPIYNYKAPDSSIYNNWCLAFVPDYIDNSLKPSNISSTALQIKGQHGPIYTTSDYFLSDLGYQNYYVPHNGSLGFVDDLEDENPDDDDTGEGGGTTGGDTGGGNTGDNTGGDNTGNTGGDNDTTIDAPNIEYDESLIPYDLNEWDKVFDVVLPTLRKVFSIGFPLFLIMLGVMLLMKLIRHVTMGFFGGGKKSGGSKIKVDD